MILNKAVAWVRLAKYPICTVLADSAMPEAVELELPVEGIADLEP
ncbi:hypothetical protein ACFWWM_34765 [Streptomyces sp. NPDC058682]